MRGLWVLPVLLVLAGFGCDDGSKSEPVDTSVAEETAQDVAETSEEVAEDTVADEVAEEVVTCPDNTAPDALKRFCICRDTTSTVVAVGPTGGEYVGAYQDLPAGSVLFVNILPTHPFHLGALHVAFAGVGSGTAHLRLVKSFGGSYPDLSADGDVIRPLDVDVTGATSSRFFDVDLTDQDVSLLPGRPYALVYEMVANGAPLAIELAVEGDLSDSGMSLPGEPVPYGVSGPDGEAVNFRFFLTGEELCPWTDEERLFEPSGVQPFDELKSERAAFADLDGDGHDDLILNDGGAPHAFRGDGLGGFEAFDAFPAAERANMVVFGDLDNDGDIDGFASTYNEMDFDEDSKGVGGGDCDDSDATVHVGAVELPDNGRDDDCDGTADNNIGDRDEDLDGVTVAQGDCDDTKDTTYPGAPELQDKRDNDCDRWADEDFPNHILLNDGTGHFTRLESSGVETFDPTAAAALGDGNEDGVLDVYWGNWLYKYPNPQSVPDVYVTGRGDGTFVDATATSGVKLTSALATYGVLWADYDNNGHPDIWVGNYGYDENLLFKNLGNGTYTNQAPALGVNKDGIGAFGGNTFGGTFGDLDNDGDLDLFAANLAHPRYQPQSDRSTLLINQGAPNFNFVEATVELGFEYDEGDVNATFADFDNDMDLDLVVASLYGGHYSRLYRNDGDAGYTNVTYEAGVAIEDSVSPAWSDLDEDGDLDLVISDRPGALRVNVFTNRFGNQNHWLQLVLEGTTANHDAIGARVIVIAGGVTQIREVAGGGGHSNTQSSKVVHVGLAQLEAIDKVLVRWPGGATETITGLSPGHRFKVVQGSGVGTALP